MQRRALPLLERHAHQTSLCTYCPKLCRPACPVSTTEGRETVTPWGKMRAVDEVRRGVASLDHGGLDPAYACTGCMRCRTMCELDNPPAHVLRDARAVARDANAEPDSMRAFLAEFPARMRRVEARARAIDAPSVGALVTATVAYLPGCTRVALGDGAAIRRLQGTLSRWLSTDVQLVADVCCGAPLLEAGDRTGFETHVRALVERLGDVERVVASDAGCAFALRVLAPSLGIATPRTEHLTELAHEQLEQLEPLADPPARVAYHDSCRLGRGLGVYDPPRAVLTRLLGRVPLELAECREQSACSGAGGLLPVTRRATADAIASELSLLVDEADAALVVTGCAASRARLTRRGVRAIELDELLYDSLARE